MLPFLDILLTGVHLAIVFFNLLGWIPRSTRKAHFISILLTAGSWLVLGLWKGLGYCPFTDWQWEVKERLGVRDLPANFIEYMAEQLTGTDLPALLVTRATAIGFAAAAFLSVYVNFLRRKKA